jgi:hypothetical protein
MEGSAKAICCRCSFNLVTQHAPVAAQQPWKPRQLSVICSGCNYSGLKRLKAPRLRIGQPMIKVLRSHQSGDQKERENLWL